MSNSPLVDFVHISPNKRSPRTHIIDTITIHCMACDLTVERLGEVFARATREASSNYGIGSDGRVGMYVEEKDRSWCSSSGTNDDRAVTIEVANVAGAEKEWPVSLAAFDKLILLTADICQRNGIKKLLWEADPNLIGKIDKQNMTVHRWFRNKDCPGGFLYSSHKYIATKVNEIIAPYTDDGVPYLVRINTSDLNVRKGPGTNTAIVKTLVNDKNVYTIVEEADGPGASKWGKLRSGVGWISLDYIKRL